MTIKDIPKQIIALLVLGLAYGIVAGLFFLEIPQGNREAALIVLGAVMTWVGAVVGWYFGSSEGSQRKSELLERAP